MHATYWLSAHISTLRTQKNHLMGGNRISRVVARCLAVTAFAAAAVHPCSAFGEQGGVLVAPELRPRP